WIKTEIRSYRLQAPRSKGPLGMVSVERIREEILRLLSQTRAAPILWRMDQCGLLTLIFPEMEPGRRVGIAFYGRGGVIKHALQSVENVEWILSRISSSVPYFPRGVEIRQPVE